ncbi:MAG: hypothetical protein R3E97_09660 [Candidatus Eisenbacteria bacterium]
MSTHTPIIPGAPSTPFALFPLVVLLALAGGILTTTPCGAQDMTTRQFDAKSGGTLTLDFPSGGSSRIEGWDEDRIEVTIEAGQPALEDWNLDFDDTGDGLDLTAKVSDRRYQSTSLHVAIRVPRRFDVEFETAGGSLSIAGVEGTFEARTAGGELHLERVTGHVDFRSGGGDIEVLDSKVDGRVTTGGGRILVKDVIGDLEATSGGGNVQYVNVRDHDGKLGSPLDPEGEGTSAETVMIQTAGGPVSVDDAPEGALLLTGGGDIRVRGAERFVQATTGGGDISVRLGEGWVSAMTGAGDIDVSIARAGGTDDIVLLTGYGDVTLVVPADYAMDLDVDIQYTRESSRRFAIESDFGLETEESPEWERPKGSNNWVKHITCTDRVNGGGQRVRIECTNGDVRIRKQ